MGGGCYIRGAELRLIGQVAQGPFSPRALSWIIGADLGWNPVTNLNFDLELMYQGTTQTRPSGFLGTVYNAGAVNRTAAPRSSCPAPGKATATVLRAVSASPVTSDRNPIS